MNTPSPPSGHLTSLRARLARRVLVPLALVWLAGTTITVSAAYYFAAQAFDRSLLDDAYALAAQVQATPQGLEVKLTSGDLSTLLFDQSE